ncbi:hypothetical protein CLRAG_29940 [Clostridium ragsdalei P11]|uniref:Uncharacterized protein n=1 Tax=Clostridium ragsdalei P11 TaxID=1353534 RepID=A0A1A6AMY0_9CLOT|nr:hypothetical protein [Clostridium ragsdalei]OBR91427.1 hypothetical protein CLRAG_29940 [Clostridium ragsdalei P11]
MRKGIKEIERKTSGHENVIINIIDSNITKNRDRYSLNYEIIISTNSEETFNKFITEFENEILPIFYKTFAVISYKQVSM